MDGGLCDVVVLSDKGDSLCPQKTVNNSGNKSYVKVKNRWNEPIMKRIDLAKKLTKTIILM